MESLGGERAPCAMNYRWLHVSGMQRYRAEVRHEMEGEARLCSVLYVMINNYNFILKVVEIF